MKICRKVWSHSCSLWNQMNLYDEPCTGYLTWVGTRYLLQGRSNMNSTCLRSSRIALQTGLAQNQHKQSACRMGLSLSSGWRQPVLFLDPPFGFQLAVQGNVRTSKGGQQMFLVVGAAGYTLLAVPHLFLQKRLWHRRQTVSCNHPHFNRRSMVQLGSHRCEDVPKSISQRSTPQNEILGFLENGKLLLFDKTRKSSASLKRIVCHEHWN